MEIHLIIKKRSYLFYFSVQRDKLRRFGRRYPAMRAYIWGEQKIFVYDRSFYAVTTNS